MVVKRWQARKASPRRLKVAEMAKPLPTQSVFMVVDTENLTSSPRFRSTFGLALSAARAADLTEGAIYEVVRVWGLETPEEPAVDAYSKDLQDLLDDG